MTKLDLGWTKYITVSGTVFVVDVPDLSRGVDSVFLESGIRWNYIDSPYFGDDCSFEHVLELVKTLEFILCTDEFLTKLLKQLPYHAPYTDDIPNYDSDLVYKSTKVDGTVV